jgi:hypothetical protein
MLAAKPIPAIYQSGCFTLTEKLNLPEKARVYLLLVEPVSEADLIEFESEQAAGEDYLQFEKENNCEPSVEELEYYNRIAVK